MWDWSAVSARELQQRLKTIPFNVPPRGMGRTKQHIENWVLRHLLWTLANATALLTFPLSVKKGERPDLDAETASKRIGIEVTEAIPQHYAHAVAIQNREYPTAILDPSLFQYGEPARDANQVRHLLQQAGDRLIGPGWMGESVEEEWAARIAAAVLSKTELLNEPSFRRQEDNWLAIYDNTPRPYLKLDVALGYLGERLASVRRGAVEFDHVFVELSNELVMVASNRVCALRLYRP
jgi:hypothetical protein